MNRVKAATNLLKIKSEGFSARRIYIRSWKRLFFRIIVLCIAVYYYFYIESDVLFLFLAGMLVGATLQDIGWVLSVKKQWGFTKEVTDWEKVEKIANDS